MKELNLIVATTTDYGIGYQNDIPWNIPEELKGFRKITTTVNNINKKNCVIMGKNTWLSLPNPPLKNRINIVISFNDYDILSKTISKEDVIVLKSINDAILYININDNIEKGFIIGGSQLYNDFLDRYVQHITYVYMSIINDNKYTCDKFIASNIIFNNFKFEKENIHFTDKYITMCGENTYNYKIIDEPID
jgi:dihydrofolate reductase